MDERTPMPEPAANTAATNADNAPKDPTEGMNRHQRRKYHSQKRHEAGEQRARQNSKGK